MLKKLTQNNYTVSRWSGGTTTQLAIYPPGARYSERTFLWRVSSATVDLERSDFTLLPDYERIIAPVKGSMKLSHGGAPVELDTFSVHRFDGAAPTVCEGRCSDFNLMLRKGMAEGELLAASAGKKDKLFGIDLAAGETALVYAVLGRLTVSEGSDIVSIKAGESCLVKASWDCSIRLRLSSSSSAMTAVISEAQ